MTQQNRPNVAIIGCVGVPASYGGFETLAEQLVRHHAATNRPEKLSVYCTARAYPDRPASFERAELLYSNLSANGPASIAYDTTTLRHAIRQNVDIALILGVSGAIALPFMHRGRTKIIAHVDGLEGQRQKWSAPIRRFLRFSEALAVRHADAVIADSPAIADHLAQTHGVRADVIEYGGDHAVAPGQRADAITGLPQDYTLGLCRIVPENNVDMILEAYAHSRAPLVFVGNWDDSRYGRALREKFRDHPTLHLLDPVHEAGQRHALRNGARAYVHGHSVGGTNPALVEMMHFGIPILAFDCVFNRHATDDKALYFRDAGTLQSLFGQGLATGAAMQELARARYCWDLIGTQYFDLFERVYAKAPARPRALEIKDVVQE